jgi:hypothetical protein
MGQEDDLGKKRREKESNSNAMEPGVRACGGARRSAGAHSLDAPAHHSGRRHGINSPIDHSLPYIQSITKEIHALAHAPMRPPTGPPSARRGCGMEWSRQTEGCMRLHAYMG